MGSELIYILFVATAFIVVGELYTTLRDEQRESARLRAELSTVLKKLSNIEDNIKSTPSSVLEALHKSKSTYFDRSYTIGQEIKPL